MEEVKNFDFYLIGGKWHHCVWVNDEGKMKQYVDGVLILEQKPNATYSNKKAPRKECPFKI